MEELERKINELTLLVQQLEQRVTDLENGEFGTGIYLDGCSEADAKYITTKTSKKDGE